MYIFSKQERKKKQAMVVGKMVIIVWSISIEDLVMQNELSQRERLINNISKKESSKQPIPHFPLLFPTFVMLSPWSAVERRGL